MKIKELEANGLYTYFARMGDETRSKMISTLNYIKQIAAVTETDINSWDINEVFGTRGNQLLLDKKEINKRFVEMMKGAVTAKVAEKTGVSKEIAELHAQINSNIGSVLTSRINSLNNKVNSLHRDHLSRILDANSKLEEAVKIQHEILALSKGEIDIAGHITRINNGGFWKFIKYENSKLVFVSNKEIILRHIDPREKTDISVNLGRYKVDLSINGVHVNVSSFDNGVLVGALSHPHVNGGSVCWGNAASTAANLITSFNISGYMQLLANLLLDYNKDNPYMTIYNFLVARTIVDIQKMRSDKKVSSSEIAQYILSQKIENIDKKCLFQKYGITVPSELQSTRGYQSQCLSVDIRTSEAPPSETQTIVSDSHDDYEDEEDYEDEDEDGEVDSF